MATETTYTAADVPEQLIEDHRTTWVTEDWWEDVIEAWVEDLPKRGIDVAYRDVRLMNGKTRAVPDVCFQLFVQGEHVAFKAETHNADEWAKLFAHAGCTGKFPVFEEYLQYASVPFSAHSGCGYSRVWRLELDEEFIDFPYYLDSDSGAADVLQGAIETELPGVIEVAQAVYEGAAEALREALYAEHDYLTSDAFIAEMIAECYPEWIDRWWEAAA